MFDYNYTNIITLYTFTFLSLRKTLTSRNRLHDEPTVFDIFYSLIIFLLLKFKRSRQYSLRYCWILTFVQTS
jgi:hypothetical protein